MRHIAYSANNHLQLLHCGQEYFPALIAACDSAQIEIYLETYIFSEDMPAQTVLAALRRAATRGVIVKVIVDWLGCGQARCVTLAEECVKYNIHLQLFNPWFKNGITRSHRKLCVIDRCVAFVGGININDDFHCDFDESIVLSAPRWDFAVKIVGPLVPQIHQEVETQWEKLGKLHLKQRWQQLRAARSDLPQLRAGTIPERAAEAALVVRDSLRHRRTIQRAYLQALGHARHSVLLANPYFAPGRKLRDALTQATRRGVSVTLLLGVGQFRLQDAVAKAFYPKLLKAGVKIVEFRTTQLHAKVAVIDEAWATVGSSNYDGLSLFINQEANIFVQDKEFAAQLRAQIEQGIAQGTEIRFEEFGHVGWHRRLWHATAFALYQIMIRIVTWGNYN